MKTDARSDWTEPRMVVSLKVGASVQIGPVNVQVIERHGNSVRIAILAPRHFEIARDKDVNPPLP